MEHVLCRTSTSTTFAKAIGYSHSEPSAIPLTWAGFNATLSDKNCRTTTGVVVPILNVPPVATRCGSHTNGNQREAML